MEDLAGLVRTLKKHKEVETIMQFGSSLQRADFRDIDLCIFTTRSLTMPERLKLLRGLPEKFDVSFYEDLPLHLKREVLQGKVLFTRNYYALLKQIQYVDLEYPRYQAFQEEYHREMVAAL